MGRPVIPKRRAPANIGSKADPLDGTVINRNFDDLHERISDLESRTDLSGSVDAAIQKRSLRFPSTIDVTLAPAIINDWRLAGIGSADMVRITLTGNAQLGGISGGVDGRCLAVLVRSNVLSIHNDSTGSLPQNRIMTPLATEPLLLGGAGGTGAGAAIFYYDGILHRWVLFAGQQ